MAVTLYCPGDISTEGGTPICSSQWEVAPYVPPFEVSQLDPALMGQSWGVGFMISGSFLVSVIGIRIVVQFFKKL